MLIRSYFGRTSPVAMAPELQREMRVIAWNGEMYTRPLNYPEFASFKSSSIKQLFKMAVRFVGA